MKEKKKRTDEDSITEEIISKGNHEMIKKVNIADIFYYAL